MKKKPSNLIDGVFCVRITGLPTRMILISSLLILTAAMERTTLTVSWILNMEFKAPPQQKANLFTSESSLIEPDHCSFETFYLYLEFTRWCYCDVKMTWNMCYGHCLLETNRVFYFSYALGVMIKKNVVVIICIITFFFSPYTGTGF